MQRLRWFVLVVNMRTAVLTLLAIASTWACLRWEILADFPMTLVALAIVFPVVFSIGGAYKRRETVLKEYALLKGHAMAIFWAVRDWIQEPPEAALAKARTLIEELFSAFRHLLRGPSGELREREAHVYRCFGRLSEFIRDELRARDLPSGEVSRANQYLSKMMVAFENVKHIYQYRTPRTLRAYSDLFITILPPLYGPYFAHIAQEYPPGLAYVTPALFTMVLVGLDNIQAHLENPFDRVGRDDVSVNVEELVARLH